MQNSEDVAYWLMGNNCVYSRARIYYTNPMEPAVKKLTHASVKSQLMQAILGEHFRFASLKQAQVKLASLATEFILPKQHLAEVAADAVVIWIKDFQVTAAEAKQGYRGNFAIIHYKTAASVSRGGVEKYTLFATKLAVELARHPQQQRRKTSHPNWGHPILRLIEKGKRYDTLAEAERDLQLLHEEYPTTTIPLGNKLNIMIYSAKYGNHVRKFVLEITSDKSDGFVIAIIERAEKKSPSVAAVESVEAAQPKGKFTGEVQLRRSQKRKTKRGPVIVVPEKIVNIVAG